MVERNPTSVDLIIDDIGATDYNVYVSTDPSTAPFDATPTAGKVDCGMPVTPAGGGSLVISGYVPEVGILQTSDVYFMLVTGDSGAGSEGPLGFTSGGTQRSANTACAP